MLLHQLIENKISTNPKKIALICHDRAISYELLNRTSVDWAKVLKHYGVNRDNRVALLFYNSIKFVQSYFACFRVGGIAVPHKQ